MSTKNDKWTRHGRNEAITAAIHSDWSAVYDFFDLKPDCSRMIIRDAFGKLHLIQTKNNHGVLVADRIITLKQAGKLMIERALELIS